MMEENTELEEGEACYYKDDDGNIDLDSLSYIDERIQHVLGHFQKDFEGGVSAENLGAKFGGYGSFLPTYERSPSFRPHPKTPQRNYSSPKSPSNLQMEAASHISKAPSSVLPYLRLGPSCNAHSFHNSRVPSVDDSMKKGMGISSNVVAESCPLKDDGTKKSANLTDQRTLKFRIKMKSDKLAQMNAAIYSGLGLDNSPSSSMGNSLDESDGIAPLSQESDGIAPLSQESDDESPMGIIQVMTSFPVVGGMLISPLHDNLLNLIRKEKVLGDSRPVSSCNGHQEHCSMSTDESDSFVGDGQLLKRKVRIVGQGERQFQLKNIRGNGVESDMTLRTKKRLENSASDCKDFLPNDLKFTPLSSSICDVGENVEVPGKASEVSKEVSKNGVKGRMLSSEAVKEESLESITGQEFDKSEKQHTGNGAMEKGFEHKLAQSHKDNSTDSKNNVKCEVYMTSKRAERDVIKCNVDQDTQMCDMNQKGMPVFQGKNKSKGDQSPSKAVIVAKKDSFGAANNAMVSDKKSAGFGVASSKSRVRKSKSLKDDKVRDSNRGKNSEYIVDRIDSVDGPPDHRAVINDYFDNVEEQSAYGVKVKERPTGNKMGNQLIAGPYVKGTSNVCPPAENKSVPEVISAAPAPVLISEDWVCCDSCQKWRLLPLGTKPEQLPEKWLCSMLNWLPGMNRCDISEEETTKALHALYQMPISEGQNNMQSHATGSAVGVSSIHVQVGLNYQKSSSDVLSDRGKKKHGFKEKTKARISSDMFLFSNYLKNNAQESGKNRSLTDMNQHTADPNLMKKSSSQHLSRLNTLAEEKHMPKEKKNQKSEGDGKHIKLKRKMDADQCRSGAPKKSKTGDVFYTDKKLNPGMDLDEVGPNFRNGLSIRASGKDMRKYDEYCLSEDVQNKLVAPVKKQGDQAQVLLDGGPLDVANNSKNDSSRKKKKLKDQQNNGNVNSTFLLQDGNQYGKDQQNNGNINSKFLLQDGNHYGEEGSVSGFGKKYNVLNTETKPVIEDGGKLNRKGSMGQVSLSGSRVHMLVGTEAVRSIDKYEQRRKQSRKIAHHQALSDHLDPLGRELGSGQILLAATSSSSKVSGSHKARTNFEDVKGSPVESVTSSPLRTINLDKLTLAGGDTLGKDDAKKVRLSSMSSRRCLNNGEGKRSIKMKKDRVSYDLHPETHKFSSIEYQFEDANNIAMVQAKTASVVQNDQLCNGCVDSVEHGECANSTNHGDGVNNNNQESVLSQQKSCKVTSLQGKEKDRRSSLEIDKDKKNVSASDDGYSKNDGTSAVNPSNHVSGHETRSDAKYSFPMSKPEIDNNNKKDFARHWSNENGKQNELKQKDVENSALKVDASCSTNRKVLTQQNLIQDVKEENRSDPVCTELRDRKLKVFSSPEGEEKRGTLPLVSTTVPAPQKGNMSNGYPVHASGSDTVAKLVKSSAEAGSKVGVNHSSRNFGPDQQLTVSSPARRNSNQAAFNTLKDASKLKDRAEHYKSLGFEFESNETYFEAALKFLHGASLLENSHSESSKHGEMSQLQIYATAAKLFESCAHEYERRQELAAAALAYKCMEVAYMRVVYCKLSSANRDRRELQSTLQMVPQGESPSSSASDVDNLNNQMAADKGTSTRATGTHATGNHVIYARRLLDFTQDVSFAMDASRKCQSTFEVANMIVEEARNRDCMTSVRSVIDISFQDVDELVRLVWTATKAISRAGLGGARD